MNESTVTAAASEAAWLQDFRAQAARAYLALPMPTAVLRPWRYTGLGGLDIEAFPPAAAALRIEGAAPASGFAGRLTDAAASDVARTHLGTVITATEGKFIAANAARWEDGVLIHVPRGQTFEQPVVVTLDASALGSVAVYPRILVVAEEQGEVTVVLRMASGARSAWPSRRVARTSGPVT